MSDSEMMSNWAEVRMATLISFALPTGTMLPPVHRMSYTSLPDGAVVVWPVSRFRYNPSEKVAVWLISARAANAIARATKNSFMLGPPYREWGDLAKAFRNS